MINEERIFRALERIEQKQGEHTERLAVVETKLDEVRKEAADDRQVIKDHSEELKALNKCTTEHRTGVVILGWLGSCGFFSGMAAAAKVFLFGANQ